MNPLRLRMKHALRFILALLLLPLTLPAAEVVEPNVLPVDADGVAWADVGYHNAEMRTPNLDALARSGIRFTSGYVTGPLCSLTRAALMAGRHQCRFGHEFNPPAITEPNPGKIGRELVDLKGYITDVLADEAVDFMRRHREEPFFLYLAFNAVHTPMDATAEALAKFSSIEDPHRRTCAAMTWKLDEAVGRITQNLRDPGLAEKTLVFFLSDNGGPLVRGAAINGSSNAPLRGGRTQLLEGGIRVPCMAIRSFIISRKTSPNSTI